MRRCSSIVAFVFVFLGSRSDCIAMVPPAATNDTLQTIEDTPLASDISANDSWDGIETIQFSILQQGAHSVSALFNDGNFTFIPNENFFGSDSVAYTICNELMECDTAWIFVQVLPIVDDAPIAVDDAYTMIEDETFVASLAANDFDPDDELLLFTLLETNIPGIATLSAEGSLEILPDANVHGNFYFIYTCCDQTLLCDTATVQLSIVSLNDAPVVIGESFTTDEGIQINATVAGNDTDPDDQTLYYFLLDYPADGYLTLSNDGYINYYPDYNFSGEDFFTYWCCDASLGGLCTAGLVEITVQPVNDYPTAYAPLNIEICENGNAQGDLTPNPADSEGDLLTLTEATCAQGTITFEANGQFEFTANPGFTGSAMIHFTVCDDGEPVLCDDGTSYITVSPNEMSVNNTSIYDASCNGYSDGCVVLSVTGGVGPYSYLWSNGSTTTSLLNVVAGNYAVTITDQGGCAPVTTFNFEIKSPEPLGIDFTVGETDCITQTADIELHGTGGTSPYSFDQGIHASDSVLYDLPAGFYTFTITDSEDCVAEATVQIPLVNCADFLPPDFFIPDGFSPDNDGVNDTFEIPSLLGATGTMFTVFNEAGAIVFSQANYDGLWNGQRNGSNEKVRPGTYYYLLELENGIAPRSGYITIRY